MNANKIYFWLEIIRFKFYNPSLIIIVSAWFEMRIIKQDYFLLFFLWFILTAINIDKAYHIDDTFHLEASEHINNYPLQPMSGLINWGDVPTPIYSHNQPPLFYYLIAFFLSFFGNNEVSLHIFLSIFTFLSLFFFYKIGKLLQIKNIRILLIFFAFCPAFFINQNLMADVPILSLILGATYFLLKAKHSNKLINYSIASFLIGCGLLIKYSVLPILIVIVIVIILRRDFKNLIVILIPISMLALWSFWNFAEFGTIHIFDRPKGVIHINHLWEFLACLGSISTFSISLVYGLFPGKFVKSFIYLILFLFISSIVLFYWGLMPENQYKEYLNLGFIINGILVFLVPFVLIGYGYKMSGLKNLLTSNSFILFLFFSSLSSFMILFAPFIATRHILLTIPFILLLSHNLIDKVSTNINRLSIIVTICFGLILGFSDWEYSNYYRKMSSEINLPKDSKIWTAGHWGWQWYSRENGMNQYDLNISNVKNGDYFVYPANISRQKISDDIDLILVDKKWKESNLLTFFSGNNFASLYNSSMANPPWTLSVKPIDTILIFKVELIEQEPTLNN